MGETERKRVRERSKMEMIIYCGSGTDTKSLEERVVSTLR